MEARNIKRAMQLADNLAGLLRTTALTVGPPLLRYVGDKDGGAFTGLVPEPSRAAHIEPPKTHPFGTAITYGCGSCGGLDVRIAAYAEWNTDKQEWTCTATYQSQAECSRCGPHILIVPRPVSRPHP